ncbi:MAG: class I SAM-dependent methyltransferase, partial [Actinobacteria bacterium]|nr:class I SAM-dependent methyltransferase [Actinomycetota bacterium]
HIICNTMSGQKIKDLFSILNIKPKTRVLDIACGKGEPVVMLAEQYDVSAVAVDLSPYYIKECRDKKNKRVPDADIEIIEMDGALFKPAGSEKFDISMCLGASFVFGGFKNTLKALKDYTKPLGIIISGEPYWIKEPDSKYLEISELEKEMFNSHSGNVEMAEQEGLACLYAMTSSTDDWDHYETLQWCAAYDYIEKNPCDADNAELMEKIDKAKKEYLYYGRDTVGWAIYVFKKIKDN